MQARHAELTMSLRVRSLALLLTVLAACPAGFARDTERAYGPWTLRCQPPAAGTPASCIMFQNLVLKTGGQTVLQFGIGRAPGDDTPTVLVSLPLGMALPPGITIQIDDTKPANFPIERCEPDGCHAAMKLRDATIGQLRRGQRLTITFYDGARKPIVMPLSLAGFSDGFDALTAPAK